MQGHIHNGFVWLGSSISRQPRKTALLVGFLSLLLAAGWSQIFIEDRPERLYTPQASRAFTDKQWVESNFGHGFRRLDVFVTAKDATATPLASKAALRDVFDLY